MILTDGVAVTSFAAAMNVRNASVDGGLIALKCIVLSARQ